MLNNRYILIIQLSVSLILGSCHKEGSSYTISSGADAENFIKKEKEKNTDERKIKEVNYKLKYISNEQMALQQVSDLSKIDQKQFDSIVKDYDGLMFFNLEISIDHFNDELLKYKLDGNFEASYNERVDYYSFKMQKDLNIVVGQRDTIPCSLYHFERNYGISPSTNFILGFKSAKIKDAVLVYENKHLNTGPVKFALNEQEILNHPQIKIN